MVQSLNIGKNALIVNQAALSVVSNNIANMNTIGYSKQRVNLTALHHSASATNVYQQATAGYGVALDSITRYRDTFLDSYYRDSLSSKNYYESLVTNGALLESIGNELGDTGLSQYLDAFFKAANNVSLYPTDVTMKTDFVQQAQNVATQFNNIATQLTAARTNLVGDPSNISTYETCTAKIYTDEINQLLSDFTQINQAVIYQHNTKVGNTAGLLDDRDAIIDKLAEYIPITVENCENGSANLYLGNIQLVGGSDIRGQFKVNRGNSSNPTIISFESDKGEVFSSNVKSAIGENGKLGAVLTLGGDGVSEVTIKSMLDGLNALASNFASEVNNIQTAHTQGPPTMAAAYYSSKDNKLHNSTTNIFNYTTSAATISVNSQVLSNPELIATAYVPATYTPPDPLPDPYYHSMSYYTINDPTQVGNNNSAQKFVNLREKSVSGLKGLTLEDYNTAITTDFGSKLASANTNYQTQEKVLVAANEKRESANGVNIEEELMDLIKFQRAYEASATVFTTANEVLETLVNIVR